MPHRLRELEDVVNVTHDGETVQLEPGKPLAFGLLADNRLLLSRSPKLHRPRGPYCLRGACEGCLARVNGVPNVMTCLVPARGGEVVETQNVLGSREHDLLAASDFMFPQGFDHHRLFAGVAGLTNVVQAFARRIAGLGQMPDAVAPVRDAQKRAVDVLVIGGGAAGLSAAATLGPQAVLMDDDVELGGSLRLLDPALADASVEKAHRARAELNSLSSVVSLSREPDDGSGRITALVLGRDGCVVLRCSAVIIASGTHDYAPVFENNDLPGIFSARAALRLWRAGIAVGRRVGVVGSGRFGKSFVKLASHLLEVVPLEAKALRRAVGRTALRGVVIEHLGSEKKLDLDALVVDGPGAPAFELLVQAGGSVSFDPDSGYVPILDVESRAAKGVFCAGGVTGASGIGAALGERSARIAELDLKLTR
jgi:sarcosine oxidase subunit alpha